MSEKMICTTCGEHCGCDVFIDRLTADLAEAEKEHAYHRDLNRRTEGHIAELLATKTAECERFRKLLVRAERDMRKYDSTHPDSDNGIRPRLDHARANINQALGTNEGGE